MQERIEKARRHVGQIPHLHPLLPGDPIHMILVTPMALSGPTSAPTLERLGLSDLQGGICHHATGSGTFAAEGVFSAATNNVSDVPKPANALMLPLGMLVIAAVPRRRLAKADASDPPGHQRVVRVGDGDLSDRAAEA